MKSAPHREDETASFFPSCNQSANRDEQEKHTNGNNTTNNANCGNVRLALSNASNGNDDNGHNLCHAGVIKQVTQRASSQSSERRKRNRTT
jgi:hypothetical protein